MRDSLLKVDLLVAIPVFPKIPGVRLRFSSVLVEQNSIVFHFDLIFKNI